MKQFLLGFAALLVLPGCVSMLPAEQRQFEISRSITVDEATAYKRAMIFLAKNMGNAKESIRYYDPETKNIVVPVIVPCKELNQTFDPNDYSVSTMADIKFSEKTATFLFTGMVTTTKWYTEAGNNAQMVSEESLNAGKRCLFDNLAKPMLKQINDK